MKTLINPIQFKNNPEIDFSKKEEKDYRRINTLAKINLRKIKDEIKNAIVHITFTDIYIQRYKKKKNKLNK